MLNLEPSSKLRGIAMASAVAIITQAAVPTAQAAERVKIGTFAIDQTEVTIAAFRAFVTANAVTTAAERAGGGYEFVGGWTRRQGWMWSAPYGERGTGNEPAVHVTWAEASSFCAHVGGRLPTMAEWRLAAYTETRAAPLGGFVQGRTYDYAVGDSPGGMNNSRKRHVPVGTTKQGVNGLYDMGGNVWEWVADRRGDDALTAGGSWWYGPEQSKATGAQWKAADFYAVYVGFRCAYELQS